MGLGGHEGEGIDGQQCVALDAEQRTGGRVGVDDLAAVAIDGEEGIADPVDGRHHGPATGTRGAGGAPPASSKPLRSKGSDMTSPEYRRRHPAAPRLVVSRRLG